MTIKSSILTALTAVLGNTWATELPPDPTWPVLVFDVESKPEDTWVVGGGYDQHTVTVVIFARTLAEIPAYQTAIDAAMGAVTGYMVDEDRGDASYEPDPSIYGFFSQHVIRTRR